MNRQICLSDVPIQVCSFTAHRLPSFLPQLAPAYKGLELGIGESLLVKAIASATRRSVQQIKAEAVEKGDLGIVAVVGEISV